MRASQLDEAEDRRSRYGGAGLVLMKRSERDLQGRCQERAAIFSVKGHSNLPNPTGQAGLDGLPVRVVERILHVVKRVFHGDEILRAKQRSRSISGCLIDPASL